MCFSFFLHFTVARVFLTAVIKAQCTSPYYWGILMELKLVLLLHLLSVMLNKEIT